MFCSDKEYYIDFESFIENFSPYSKQIIQLTNRYQFNKDLFTIDYSLYTYNTKYTKYFIYKSHDNPINLTLEKNISILHQYKYNESILDSDGYILAFKKIETNDGYRYKG